MNKYATILLIIIVGFLVWIYFDKESGHDQAMIEKDKAWENKIDSLETAYKDSLHSRELFYLKSFSEAIKRSDFYEGEALAYKRKYLNEKNSHRRFVDADRDSLVSSIGLN